LADLGKSKVQQWSVGASGAERGRLSSEGDPKKPGSGFDQRTPASCGGGGGGGGGTAKPLHASVSTPRKRRAKRLPRTRCRKDSRDRYIFDHQEKGEAFRRLRASRTPFTEKRRFEKKSHRSEGIHFVWERSMCPVVPFYGQGPLRLIRTGQTRWQERGAAARP